MQEIELFGHTLKRRRKELDLTQVALSQLASCSVDTVKKLEAGTIRPSRYLARTLAVALEISAEQEADFIQLARVPLRSPGPVASAAQQKPRAALGKSPINLPALTTSLVGREYQVQKLRALLAQPGVRLLTLVGPPGVGKTRLSIQIAAGAVEQFRDGVFFVPLATITDPQLVPLTVARVLGIKDSNGSRTLLETLEEHLRDKELLLVLDNFEQVIEGATAVSSLLGSTPLLKVLVTSRETLHLYGEHEFPVPPLALPDPAYAASAEEIGKSEAVELFIQRARAVKPDFRLSEANGHEVAEICHRVDGLPLAIELAASYVKILRPQDILERLDRRLKLLTGGPRDLPARQQTLRGAIEWSYSLLSTEEQSLFRVLSIFTGGCQLVGIAAVYNVAQAKQGNNGSADILPAVASLINKSLLWEENDGVTESRVGMLETIKEYGLDQIEASGEETILRQAHASYYLTLAGKAEEQLTGADQAAWLARLDKEHDNLRAAMLWAVESGQVEIGLRIASSLGRFWEVHGDFTEGRMWLSKMLALSAESVGRTAERAKALHATGNLAFRQSDYSAARLSLTEGLAVWRELDDKRGAAYTLSTLASILYVHGDQSGSQLMMEESLGLLREVGDTRGIANMLANLGTFASRRGEYASAQLLIEESVRLQRELGDKRGIANCLHALGLVIHRQENSALARRIMEEGLAIRRELNDKWGIATSLLSLGAVARSSKDYGNAKSLLEESLLISTESGDKLTIINTLFNLGFVAYHMDNYHRAKEYFIGSLDLALEQDYKRGIAECLGGLAILATVQDSPDHAILLFGAAESLKTAIGSVWEPTDQAEYERSLLALKDQVGEENWETLWAEGQAMTIEQTRANFRR